ncbi:MAG: PAS domain-containing protein [Anaerolineae bacterium]
MPVGIALFDRSLCLVKANKTWREYIERYTESKAEDVIPGVHLYTLAPGVKTNVQPLFERVLQGETIRREALEANSGGIFSYWDVVFSPLRANGQIVGIVDITTDATERVKAKRELEQTVQHLEHSRANLASLLENARGFAVYRLRVDPTQPYGGRVLMVSPSFSHITGINRPHDFGLWFANIHPADLPEALEANRQALTE